MGTIHSLSGWMAISNWATSLAAAPSSATTAGFPIITRQLAQLIREEGGPREISERLPSALPSEAARDLLSLEGTETAGRVGARLTEAFEKRLIAQAQELRRLQAGPAKNETEVPALDDPNQIVAYGASLKVGIPALRKRAEALQQWHPAGPHPARNGFASSRLARTC
jgi:hypothetical protein